MDDAEMKRRLQPLADAVLPRAPKAVESPPPVRGSKPPRKGIEFLLPEPVVTEIKMRAAQRGVSATLLLLELLQANGYPVTPEDFTDLRKTPRR
jgi:hypothetical protein